MYAAAPVVVVIAKVVAMDMLAFKCLSQGLVGVVGLLFRRSLYGAWTSMGIRHYTTLLATATWG